jgi:uncharacterized protein DUF1570
MHPNLSLIRRSRASFWLPLVFLLTLSGVSLALENLTLHRDGTDLQLQGRILLEARDGGVMLQTRDGTIWFVQPAETVSRATDDTPFVPYTAKELANRMLAELPLGFEVLHANRYVICYSTSRAYAQWCGSLFNRLHRAFTGYWKNCDFDLTEPEFPLVAVVFADKRSYMNYARPEVGDAVGSIAAYYSLKSNRIVMYDLTGAEARGGTGGRMRSSAQIARILSQPGAAQNVSAIVHEATHQIAFNCGLHARYSDCPLWFTEGIAVFFETPDVGSSRGWRKIGLVNGLRLAQFHRYYPRRRADSLVTLISDDARFRDVAQAADAYAEAWALTYFLLDHRTKEYIRYLQLLSAKKPQHWDDPAARLADFKQAFGEDLQELDKDFIRVIGGLR